MRIGHKPAGRMLIILVMLLCFFLCVELLLGPSLLWILPRNAQETDEMLPSYYLVYSPCIGIWCDILFLKVDRQTDFLQQLSLNLAVNTAKLIFFSQYIFLFCVCVCDKLIVGIRVEIFLSLPNKSLVSSSTSDFSQLSYFSLSSLK